MLTINGLELGSFIQKQLMITSVVALFGLSVSPTRAEMLKLLCQDDDNNYTFETMVDTTNKTVTTPEGGTTPAVITSRYIDFTNENGVQIRIDRNTLLAYYLDEGRWRIVDHPRCKRVR